MDAKVNKSFVVRNHLWAVGIVQPATATTRRGIRPSGQSVMSPKPDLHMWQGGVEGFYLYRETIVTRSRGFSFNVYRWARHSEPTTRQTLEHARHIVRCRTS